MSNKGKLVVVSGFSGAGKGTLMKALMEQYGDDYALSVSATTRDPRPGEKDGIDYFYVTTEKFKQMIEADELIEYAQYVENYYGTPKAYVQQQLDLGKNVILEIEIQGALKIKNSFQIRFFCLLRLQMQRLFVIVWSDAEPRHRMSSMRVWHVPVKSRRALKIMII